MNPCLNTYRSPAVLEENISDGQKIASYFLTKAHSILSMSKTSYSGCVAGVLSGTGIVSNVKVDGTVASIGEFAGLLFGGVGNGVTISSINQNVNLEQFIQPAVYGGIIAGESYGFIKDVTISSTVSLDNLFKAIPFVPYAVGGVVGLMGDYSNLPNIAQENYSDYGLSNVCVQLSMVTNKN